MRENVNQTVMFSLSASAAFGEIKRLPFPDAWFLFASTENRMNGSVADPHKGLNRDVAIARASWENAHSLALVLTGDGTIFDLNQPVANILGQPREELKGSLIWPHLRREGRTSLEAVFQRVVEEGQPSHLDIQYSGRWYSAYMTPCLDDQSQVVGVAVLAWDITDSKITAERLRKSELREYAEDPDPVTCERLAKVCLMLPPETAQIDTLAKMADTAIAAGSNHHSWVYFEFAKGLEEYRRGRYPEAAEWLQKALEQKNDIKRTVQAYATLAMAHYRLGRTDLARKTLAEGLALAKKALPPPAKEDPDPAWNDWTIARVLNQEATHLIQLEPPRD